MKPLTPASQRKILRIVEKNAGRGGRAAVIKYVKRCSKGKAGRPPKRPDTGLWAKVELRRNGGKVSIRKACRLLAEEMVSSELTVELAEELRRNYRAVADMPIKNILG